MKKLLLLFSILFTLFVNGQTSVYHPFPESNATWNFHYSNYCFANGNGDDYYSITISGDTLINGQTYQKLTTPYIQSFSTGSCGFGSIGYKGAIRQDTSFRMVFFIPPSSSSEQLLYDFTMQIGDSVKGYTEETFGSTDIVQSIDSVLVDETYRKRWNINSGYNIHFIEGIGSTYGLIEFSPGCMTDFADWTLTCFQQNGQTLYPDTTPYCQLITSVHSIYKVFHNVKVFPNPSNGTFTVDFDPSIEEVRLTDLLGNIVLRQQTNNQTNFRIDNLESGTYILTVVDKESRTSNKKIVSCP
jgi:hypothetical protein